MRSGRPTEWAFTYGKEWQVWRSNHVRSRELTRNRCHRPPSAVVTLATRGNVVERLAIRQAEQDGAVAGDTAHHSQAAQQRHAPHFSLTHGIGAVDELGLVEPKDDQRFALGNSSDGLDDEDRELRVDHDSQYDKHDEQNADGLPSHGIPLSVV